MLVGEEFADHNKGWALVLVDGERCSTQGLVTQCRFYEQYTTQEALLLNHKDALRFILDNPDYLQHLTLSHIEDIHQLLTKELSVDRGIRHRRVGITGTNYHPLDNEFQIREAIHVTCELINEKENIIEKALLTLVLLSYIQAFSDGNKRTARITSNAILIANGYCPLSFRSVDSVDYRNGSIQGLHRPDKHSRPRIGNGNWRSIPWLYRSEVHIYSWTC